MAAPRKPFEQDNDREAVGQLLVRGHSIRQIAKALGRSTPTVQADVNYLRSQWRQSAMRNFADNVSHTVAAFDEVLRRQWALLDEAQGQAISVRGDLLESIGRTVSRRAKCLGLEGAGEIARLRQQVADDRAQGISDIMTALERHLTPEQIRTLCDDLPLIAAGEPLDAEVEMHDLETDDYERNDNETESD